ncbi:MAG TPA: hypothetical protein VK435_01250 [Thermodesulfovibrionales bacterium]|nr:hypothetical protein [Thermodesulfovibrionales bacterium]
MRIDCYLSRGCASEEALKANIALALGQEGLQAQVNLYRIDSAEALSRGLSGSPSVFINGEELQPSGAIGFA